MAGRGRRGVRGALRGLPTEAVPGRWETETKEQRRRQDLGLMQKGTDKLKGAELALVKSKGLLNSLQVGTLLLVSRAAAPAAFFAAAAAAAAAAATDGTVKV